MSEPCCADSNAGSCQRPLGHDGEHRTILFGKKYHAWTTEKEEQEMPRSSPECTCRTVFGVKYPCASINCPERIAATMEKFLCYSLEPVDYDYDGLTPNERALCSREDFNAMVAVLVDEQ